MPILAQRQNAPGQGKDQQEGQNPATVESAATHLRLDLSVEVEK